jgi:uncharacterized protein (DUF924 family)
MLPGATDVLAFWFSDRASALWFEKDVAFDTEIRARYGALIAHAASGELDRWIETADGAAALLIILDQFPRNVHRGSPRAFENDAKVLELAAVVIARGLDLEMTPVRRRFVYLPYCHSEALHDQERALVLFQGWTDALRGTADEEEALDQMFFVRRHHEIIARFGRFPHRNAVLGRASTREEIAFLREPHSSF